ncbi:putative quinol monooxygenase [Novosphingobium sp.]|uniref:putative quinol monooxygenase n=1 Tax=Novosphingobium sp. TaxID=1874826 RepID=UPI0025DDFF75|nr:putative quinol monooxygenase [Novosphingobium sp.]
MILARRTIIGAAALLPFLKGTAFAMEEIDETRLYGVIGQMKATPGQRDALIGYLTTGSQDMQGNLAYLIAKDNGDADALWITEIWSSAEAHKASLKLPQVQAAIAKARPIIAGFGTRAEVTPVGGKH